MQYWFSADFHLNHKNILRYTNRPFKNINEMNYVLIKNWNSRVKPEDTVFFLGDFAFVNYFYNQIEKSKETSKETPSMGKWTDILMKKGGKWILVGDHGGRTSKTE